MHAQIPYTPPHPTGDAYNCPHCNAFAKQYRGKAVSQNRHVRGLQVVFCGRCDEVSLWIEGTLVYPDKSGTPLPNPDLPDDIRDDFVEAGSILNRSSRGSAALLRLCIQKLCKSLGEKGKNINQDIASLVKKGLPVRVQQALDTVRVVGNNAVHPGQIDLKDDVNTANALFHLVNIIADVMISQPKQVDELYNSILPENQRDAIARRDGNGTP